MKKIITTICAVTIMTGLATANAPIERMFENGNLRFDYDAQEMLILEEDAANELDAQLKKIIAIPAADRTFENTILAFEYAYNNYWYTAKTLGLLTYFHENESVREAAGQLESKGAQFKAKILARKDIYNAIKEYTQKNPALDEQEQVLLKFWLSRFQRAGAELEGEEAKEYAALSQKKMELITKYNINLMEHQDQLVLSKEQLKGMSDVYINRLNQTEDGKYIVTLKYPDYNPFMQNAEDEAARKALQIKFANRGGKENVKLLEDVLLIRSKTSRMLGYKDHPQYVLEDRMAKNEKTLKAFLLSIEKNLKSVGKTELGQYLALKEQMTGKRDAELALWDYPYYANQYKKKYHNVDYEKIKEYFPTERVINVMFETFGNLFGLTFVPANLPTWHPDVMVYTINDSETGEHIANFYMDLYPRDGKYTHAACWTFIDGHTKQDGTKQKPSIVIASNMNPAGGDIPSLLNHSEVETLFHEFGHVLQGAMTAPKYASLAGDNITWDYIETHSQLLENWAWDKDVLKKMSKHYKTGESIPEDMLENLVSSRNVGNALPMLRQNFQGQLDYQYHKSNKPVDTTKVYKKLIKEIYMLPLTEGTYPQANFAHIMSLTDPYDVGYYVYAWSLVIADDIFSIFETVGLDNQMQGKRLREYIYTPGMSKDPDEMVNKFLGRPYNNEAFLKNFGIETK
ncbi:thimet oligopeptidase [Elusimicrobium posterum]|uniref:M3 family metallopeptidase n=1 Tax=Elusimicrobium posterum TaxID=3116653 RepID=UPI003C71BD33